MTISPINILNQYDQNMIYFRIGPSWFIQSGILPWPHLYHRVAFEVGLHGCADDPDDIPRGYTTADPNASSTGNPALTPLVSSASSSSSTIIHFLYQNVTTNRSYIAPLKMGVDSWPYFDFTIFDYFLWQPTYWCRWKAEIDCFPTTRTSSRTKKYKVDSWPVIIHRR